MHCRSPHPATQLNPANQKEAATPPNTPKILRAVDCRNQFAAGPRCFSIRIKNHQSTIVIAKSIVRKILPASHLFPRFCAELVIPSGLNSNETRILARGTKKLSTSRNVITQGQQTRRITFWTRVWWRAVHDEAVRLSCWTIGSAGGLRPDEPGPPGRTNASVPTRA